MEPVLITNGITGYVVNTEESLQYHLDRGFKVADGAEAPVTDPTEAPVTEPTEAPVTVTTDDEPDH